MLEMLYQLKRHNMKKLIIATLFVGFSTLSIAQQKDQKPEGRTPEQRAEFMTASLEKSLGLSAEQRTKIYSINLERAKKIESLKAERQLKGQKGNIKEEFENTDTQILSVLNDSQKKAYQDLKAKRLEKMKANRGKGDRAFKGRKDKVQKA